MDIMEKKSFLHFLNNDKCRALLIGFAIACIHFVITPILEKSDFASLGYIMLLILISPSYIPLLFIELNFPSVSNFIDSSTSDAFLQLLLIAVSSLFYGMVGGFLVSRKKDLKSIGIILVCLLILSGFFLLILAGQFFA